MALQTQTWDSFETQQADRQPPVREKKKQDVLKEKVTIHKALTETLVKVARQITDDSKFDTAKDILDAGLYNLMILQEQLDGRTFGSSYESQKVEMKNGLLTEVCAVLTLEKLGFKVIDSTVDEDLEHGVDLYAVVPEKYGEGQVWALQVKGFKSVETPVVLDLKSSQTSEDEIMKLTKNQQDSLAKSLNALLDYLSDKNDNPYTVHSNFVDDYWVRPVSILIPTGNTDGAFRRNGEPLPNFQQQLEQAINKVFPPKHNDAKTT